MRTKRTTVAAAVAAIVATGIAVPAVAGGGARGDQTVVVVNEKDGSEVAKLRFKVVKLDGDTIDPDNAAVAVSSCEGCSTVAVSIQVVLASGEMSVVTPDNLAVALNLECESCQTYAAAYQYVYGSSEKMTFTKAGKDRLKAVKAELKGLAKEDLTVVELQARIDAITAEVRDVVQTELVAKKAAKEKAEAEATEAEAEAATEPTATEAPADTTGATDPGDASTTTTGTDEPASTTTTEPSPTEDATTTEPTDTSTESTATETPSPEPTTDPTAEPSPDASPTETPAT